MTCPCGSGAAYDACCAPFHRGEAWPDTAEGLMRARYSAFAERQFDFLTESLAPRARDEADPEATRSWAERAEWLGFDVLRTEAGGPGDVEGVVEFVARYAVEGRSYDHHEVATFERIDGRWYFVDGTVAGPGTYRREAPKVGRNDPCPCGSTRKFKKCCGAPGATQAAESPAAPQ